MNPIALPMFALMSLAVAVSGCAGEPRSEEQKAIAEIEKFGGKVLVDETMPGKPVIDVQLPAANLTDADLERLKGLTHVVVLYLPGNKLTDAGLEHLKGFAELEGLFLTGNNVTDAGLKHLKKLTRLRSLYLGSTKVTDAGLEHLKGLTNLATLDLSNTKVTDAGLEQLRGLANLRVLYLRSAKVSGDGVASLQKALPNCKIVRSPESWYLKTRERNLENRPETNLTEAEVLRIAEETAKAQGLDVGKYNMAGCHYELTRKDRTWTVFYQLKPPTPPGEHFGVSVDDRTRKATLWLGE
jgi:hypothetical protein